MAPHANNAALLEPAIRYVLGSVGSVTPHLLSEPTPCAAWDLGQLLEQVSESFAALHEGVATGCVGFGAVEMAVHGWDIARGCGCHRPIPPGLANAILEVVPLVVTDETRYAHFAGPVAVSAYASPSDRLVAALGRGPDPCRAS